MAGQARSILCILMPQQAVLGHNWVIYNFWPCCSSCRGSAEIFQGWGFFSDRLVRWKWTRCTGGEYWRLKKNRGYCCGRTRKEKVHGNHQKGKQWPDLNRLKSAHLTSLSLEEGSILLLTAKEVPTYSSVILVMPKIPELNSVALLISQLLIGISQLGAPALCQVAPALFSLGRDGKWLISTESLCLHFSPACYIFGSAVLLTELPGACSCMNSECLNEILNISGFWHPQMDWGRFVVHKHQD